MAPTLTKVAYGWDRRSSIKFGGKTIPIGANFTAGTLSYIDLNDAQSFWVQELGVPDGHTLQMARLLYRGSAIKLATDHEPVIIQAPFIYEENVQSLSQIRSTMLEAGTQWLTFDGGTTGVLCDCQSFGRTKSFRNFVDVTSWTGEMAFLCQEPFYRDIASTTVAAFNVPAASGAGTTTAFNVTYSGGVWSEPLFTFVLPSVGGSPTVTFTLTNTTAGVALVFSVPASGLTYVVDASLLQVYQSGNTGNQIAHTGSFPMLYPPSGTVNAFTCNAVCTSSCTPTLAISYQNRYSL